MIKTYFKYLIISASCMFANVLFAGFYDWQGTNSDDWSDAGNWQNDTMPSTGDTARIYNSTTTTVSTPNNTVVKSGTDAALTTVWVGHSSDSTLSGNLTVDAGGSITTSSDFIVQGNSSLSSSGSISVGSGNGMLLKQNANVTLNNGSSLTKANTQGDSTLTINAGATVTTLVNPSGNSTLVLNSTYGNGLTMNNNSNIQINGTLNGNLNLNSSAASSIGASGEINGELVLNQSDSMNIAGVVNGKFSANQTSSLTLESTAVIQSNSNESWFYDDAVITYIMGEDGSLATVETSRGEVDGLYDEEWRYAGSATFVIVLDAYDAVVNGANIATADLLSGIQNESAFASNVTFMLNSQDVTSDFTWDGAGNTSFTGTIAVPEASTVSLMVGLISLGYVLLRRRGK